MATNIANLAEAIRKIGAASFTTVSSEELSLLQQATGKIREAISSHSHSFLHEVIDNIKNAISSRSNVDGLASSADSIRCAFLANWEKEHLPGINQFRCGVVQGIPTPVLSICGRGTQEIRWTKYLSYFLNPEAMHGLGDRFVRAIIDGPIGKHISSLGPYHVDNVSNEVYIGKIQGDGCRCDIVIETDRFLIFIEQKILSGEGKSLGSGLNQLDKYTKVINESEEYGSLPCYKIYLTPNGEIPEKNADDWLPMRHDDIIRSGVELLREGKLGQVAWNNLFRLLTDLAVGPVGQVEEDLEELIYLSDKLATGGFDLTSYARYRNLRDQNSAFVQLIKEGLAWQN